MPFQGYFNVWLLVGSLSLHGKSPSVVNSLSWLNNFQLSCIYNESFITQQQFTKQISVLNVGLVLPY